MMNTRTVPIMRDRPRVVAAVEIEENGMDVIYTKIDPEVVKRIENIERMLEKLMSHHYPDEPF